MSIVIFLTINIKARKHTAKQRAKLQRRKHLGAQNLQYLLYLNHVAKYSKSGKIYDKCYKISNTCCQKRPTHSTDPDQTAF